MKLKKLLLVVLTLALGACAYNQAFVDGRRMVEAGNTEEGMARLEEAARAAPNDLEIQNYVRGQRAVTTQRLIAAGDRARAAGAFDQAEASYQAALKYDAENAAAKQSLEALAKDRRAAALAAEAETALKAGDESTAFRKATDALAESPRDRAARAVLRRVEEKKLRAESPQPELNARLKKPITMEFRDAPIRTVFDLISKNTGLNFVFDRDVPPDARATVYVRDTSIEEVIRLVLVTNQLERKVLNDNTILVYPNTPQKQQAYRELTVRSFYLANADAKQTANMVRQLVKTRDLFVDEKLNLLVMRDTPEAVRVAEKLIANQDKGEPEVMLEVEVMEVGYNQLQQLGIQWPTSAGVGVMGAAGIAGQITGSEARHFTGDLLRLNISDPIVQLNAKRQDGRTNVLANPRIRVKNKEKARVHIGDRVPVITTTAGATGFVSESVNYLDVGLKLEVEPQVYLDDDVGIKVNLEVSNVSQQVRTSSGTVAYQVGTRNANTVLRLKDGETQVLAGLINNEDRRTANRVPGLSNLPLAGRLFSSNDDTANKTEIVLLITPRVIRNIERPSVRQEEFNSGTEMELGGGGGLPVSPLTIVPAPAAQPAPQQPAPSIPSQPLPPAAGPQPQPQLQQPARPQ